MALPAAEVSACFVNLVISNILTNNYCNGKQVSFIQILYHLIAFLQTANK